MVLITTMIAPSRSVLNAPPAPRSTRSVWSSSQTIVIRMSACSPTSRGVATSSIPFAARRSIASRLRLTELTTR